MCSVESAWVAFHGVRAPVKVGALGHGRVVSEGVDGGLRPVFGNHAGGVAGLGENGDGAHGQIFGGVGDGFANRFGDGKAVTVAAAAGCVNSPMLLSASITMRDIMATASRGYRPLAVSAESMTESLPSKIALATSLASARVGRGFSIIDSSICVAVMTGLRHCGGAADDMLLNDRNFFRRHFHAQIAARDHHAIGRLPEFLPDGRSPAAFRVWR